MANPLFSVIIPTYNRKEMLQTAIQSVLAQECQSWELWIVDDGSTDDTETVVNPYLSDRRIRYLWKPNQGPSSARNRGLGQAQGQIITYIDSDDCVFPKYLSQAGAYFVQNPTKSFALVNGRHFLEFYDEHKALKATKDLGKTYNIVPTVQDLYDWKVKSAVGTGCFHLRSVFQEKVRWNSFSPLEELDFFMQLAMLDSDGFFFIPHVLYEYKQRYGTDGLCSNTSYLQWAQSFEKIYELHKSDPMMKKPEVYLHRVKKYQDLHESFIKGIIPPPAYKHFPELYPQAVS